MKMFSVLSLSTFLLFVLEASGNQLLNVSKQHVVVITENNQKTIGVAYFFEWNENSWRQSGVSVPVVVGARGLGKTCEGDKKAPQGIFRLPSAFGYAQRKYEWIHMPYKPMQNCSRCVDDVNSIYYNKIVNNVQGKKSWSSAEKMRRDIFYKDNLYKFGIVIDYNPDARKDPVTGKGAGSCIFIHIWRGPGQATAGCTALAEKNMIKLLTWLDPQKTPILIQGTRKYISDLISRGVIPYSIP